MKKNIFTLCIAMTMLALSGCNMYKSETKDFTFFKYEDNFILQESKSIFEIDNPYTSKYTLKQFDRYGNIDNTEYIKDIDNNSTILSKDTYIKFNKDNSAMISSDKIQFNINTTGYMGSVKAEEDIFIIKSIDKTHQVTWLEAYDKVGNLKFKKEINLEKFIDIHTISKCKEGIILVGKASGKINISMIDYNGNIQWSNNIESYTDDDIGFVKKKYNNLIYISIYKAESQSEILYVFDKYGKKLNEIELNNIIDKDKDYKIVNIDEISSNIAICINYFSSDSLSKIYICSSRNSNIVQELTIEDPVKDMVVIKNKIYYILKNKIKLYSK